jgi:hypothetical protein
MNDMPDQVACDEVWQSHPDVCRRAYRDFEASRITSGECFKTILPARGKFADKILYFISGIASDIDTDNKMFHDVLDFLDTSPLIDDMHRYIKWFDAHH